MLVGTTLHNHYKIIKQLGRGEFKETYLAEDTDLPDHLVCVVKRFHLKTSDLAVSSVAKSLFDKEAQVLYQLGNNYNQIPRLLARFEENSEFYLVQEYIEGYDLGQELTADKRCNEAEVSKLLQEILEGLKILHDNNVIHGNIKPENLLRRSDKKIALLDFGTIKEITTLRVNDQGQSIKPIPFVNLEYSPNEEQSIINDVYAVGMIGIQALTGVSPRLLERDPKTLEIKWRDRVKVSDRVATILNKMVNPDINQRYQSATEALQALYTNLIPAPTIYKVENFAIQPQFDEIYMFIEDLAAVKKDKKWGYIDKTGNFVIPAQYEEAYRFADGLAPVSQNKQYGYIDKTGNFVIQPQFDDAYWFADGLARAKKGNFWGYIDKSGKFVIPPEFDQAYWFTDGLAPVKKRNQYGYIDTNGKLVIQPQFPSPGWFSEGLMAVESKKWSNVKSGYIDKTGKMVIEPQFDEAYRFGEGLAPVKLNNQYGYINKSGSLVISPQFDDAYWFADGIARAKKDGKWGYINPTGNFVIPPQFDEGYWFVEELARAKKGNLWGYIDKKGDFAIEPQFEQIGSFSEGMAGVRIGNKWGFISTPIQS